MKISIDDVFYFHQKILEIEEKYQKIIQEKNEDIEQLRFKLHLKENTKEDI